MIYKNCNFYFDSDFPVRVVRELEQDIDLIVDVDSRTINLYLDEFSSLLGERIQFPSVKNILIRFSTLETCNRATIHFLRNIDLNSSIVNFEFDYKEYMLSLKNKEYHVSLDFRKIMIG